MHILSPVTDNCPYVARPGIEPSTPDLRVRCPTDCATRPGRIKGETQNFQSNYLNLFLFLSENIIEIHCTVIENQIQVFRFSDDPLVVHQNHYDLHRGHMTSIQCHYVAMTSILRHYDVICLLDRLNLPIITVMKVSIIYAVPFMSFDDKKYRSSGFQTIL